VWECEDISNRGHWRITASAEIPGDPDLIVTGEYRLPHVYAERVQGLRYFLSEIVRDAEVSLTCKYNLLVRKHAAKNKHAQAALAVITDWQTKHEKT
jgi:hypothetical protein